MANAKENVVSGAANDKETPIVDEKITVQPQKTSRRGIGNARGASRLKFSHEQAKPNGLFLGHLESVEVKTITVGEDKVGTPSFNGLDIPKLILTFASNEEEIAKRHYMSISFTAVESTSLTIPGAKEEWKVNNIFDWLKHVMNVYVTKGRTLTEEEDEALSLNYIDFDEQGEYVPVEPEVVIASWKTLFENFENIINRGREGQPVYKSKDGKFITVWMKFIRYTKHNKKGWQPISDGNLSFPIFVGDGCLEIYKQNCPVSINVNVVKESIIPMNVEKKPKSPNLPDNNINGYMGGVQVSDSMMNNNSMPYNDTVNMAAAEDMPF